MLTTAGQVKIADFGLAYHGEDSTNVTGGVEVMGTPSYMSPEQIDGRNVDHRSDLYSLGVTLYYLTTGRKPFEGSTPMEVLLKHVSEKPTPVCAINPKIPKAVGQVVERLMAKQPENRYENAGALAADLEEILQGGKPTVVVAMEDVIQRMEELVRTESGPVRDRRPMIAATFSGIAAALCLVLFTFALPEIKGLESAAAVEAENPAEKEAKKLLAAAESFAAEHPESIEEIRNQLTVFEKGYPSHFKGQAANMLRNNERKYDELSRKEANTWITQSTRLQGEGKLVQALLALDDIPDIWLHGTVRSEVKQRRERIARKLENETNMALVPGGTFLSGADKTEEHLTLDRGALVNLDTEIILEFLSKKSDYSGEENKGTAGKPDKSSAASTVAIPYQGNLKRNQIDEDTKRLKEYLEKADGILLTYITSRSCNEKGGRFEIDYRIVLNKNIHKQIVLLAGSRSIKYKRSTSREIIYEREDIGGIAQQIYDAMTPLVEGSRDARVVKFDPPFIVIDFGKENNLIPGMIGYVVEWDRSILHRQGKNTTMHYSYIAEFLVTDVFPTTSKALLIPPDPESPDYEWPVKVDDVVKIK